MGRQFNNLVERLEFIRIGVALFVMVVGQTHAQDLAGQGEDFALFSDLVRERYVQPFESGQSDQWAAAFSEDAIALHNRRPPDRGRSAIGAFAQVVHELFDLAEYDVVVTDVRRNGIWAYTVGTYTSRFLAKADGSDVFGREQGKFVLLWQLSPEGEWQIILDMGNSNS